GLKRGDIIQKIDGTDMLSAKQVQEYVRSHKVSETLNFFVIRNNGSKAIAVNIGQYPDKIASSAQSGQEDDEDDGSDGKEKRSAPSASRSPPLQHRPH